MKVSVVLSADIANGSHWSLYVPETRDWDIIQQPIPSELFDGGKHAAASRTIYIHEFQDLIQKYEIFSIDEIGYNMAIRMSCNRPFGVLKVFAFPELEDHEAKGNGEPDEGYYNEAWRGILKAISDGAKNAGEKKPQPLKSEGDNADAIPNSKRRSKTS
jgi:hypothetical protein